MATNFPTSLDAFTNPTAVDTLDSPPHDVQHANAIDAIEALQAKVGVDGSAHDGRPERDEHPGRQGTGRARRRGVERSGA